MTAFEQAFAIVVGHEGCYGVERADPGDWTGGAIGKGQLRGTKFGISAAAYPDLDIAGLTLEQAGDIYRRDYWNRIAGDALPRPLALLVFDAAVNNGSERAARWLQAAAGVVPDGSVGPATLAAVAAYVAGRSEATLCAEFQAQRMVFMAALPTWRSFGMGWARRLCALPYQSAAMAASGDGQP